ncbi:MAG: YtxH domain-containing protein [Bernardetiaceae bacterium]
MNKTVNIFLGITIGLAVGASVGLLYAPRKGRETRDKINYRLDKARDKLRELVDDLSQGDDLPNVAQEESEKVASEVRNKAQSLLSEVEDYIQKIQNEK